MSIEQIKKVLEAEADGILELRDRIDENFVKTVDEIYHAIGRVIISGIGKSGLIGQKIAATLNSTGTRALFLHPVEAVHGDLGSVSADDIFLGLSNSGETWELNNLLPMIKGIGCKIIAFTGNTDSTLATYSDIVINTHVKKEACPMGLTPTTSTTALLAAGDALAVALIEKRKFKSDDFKKNHPGGTLGQRLSAKVKDIMLEENRAPKVFESESMKNVLAKMNEFGQGVVIIPDKENKLAGIITDGDIRRLVSENESIASFVARDVMTRKPHTLTPDTPVYDALNLMEKYQIMILPITDKDMKLCGLLHIHDILGKGEFKFNG